MCNRFAKKQETIKRRSIMCCRVFELKLDTSKFNAKQIEFMKMIFIEAKWLYNTILNSEDIFKFNTRIKEVPVKLQDNSYENRKLNHISSQIKQGIQTQICDSIKALNKTKKKGRNVGRLKFKSNINSLNLKQYDMTYSIVGNKLYIQGCRYGFKCHGLEQLKGNIEIANAKLIRKAKDYYLKVTTFIDKSEISNVCNNEAIGIDFGIKTDLTLSNGIKIDTKLPISTRIKQIQRRIARSKKGSNNRYKLRLQLQKAFDKQSNQKKEIRVKICNYLKQFSLISVQNENIKGWHSGLFGKQIQQSAIGGIIAGVKQIPQTHIVNRFVPTTKPCLLCGTMHDMPLSKRQYDCECGYSNDRDIHSANVILLHALIDKNIVPTERRDIKPVEKLTAVDILLNNCKLISVRQEALAFRLV